MLTIAGLIVGSYLGDGSIGGGGDPFFGVFINKLWSSPVASGLPLSAALSSIVLRYLQSVRNALIDSD